MPFEEWTYCAYFYCLCVHVDNIRPYDSSHIIIFMVFIVIGLVCCNSKAIVVPLISIHDILVHIPNTFQYKWGSAD